VKATSGLSSVTVTWSPAATSCNVPIAGYTVWTTSYDFVCEAEGSAGSCTFPMPAGTFRFMVNAIAANTIAGNF
jgi:hypothetical protein